VEEMERLTLDEAIKHAKEVADMNYNDAEKFDSNDSVENYMKANCMKCAEQHEKLAELLEELKSYKEAEEQGLLVRLPCKVGAAILFSYIVLEEPNYQFVKETFLEKYNNDIRRFKNIIAMYENKIAAVENYKEDAKC
jgi:hypothetical protein